MNSVNASVETISINGVQYAPVGSQTTVPSGNRAVVVVDRGWIVAGDVSTDEESLGNIIVSNAVHVFRWESIGFAGVLKDPKSSKVTLMDLPYPVKVPAGSVIFQVPVPADWGK